MTYTNNGSVKVNYVFYMEESIVELGWIDFSDSERGKVMDIFDLLSKEGTLDELGIAAVRDGFADRFFPGTSTIQTRAKYFFIVPYIAKDLERGHETQPGRMRQEFDAKEKACAELLCQQEDKDGVIGRVAIENGHWVKRAPSAIYWNGLRRYGIFKHSYVMGNYIGIVCIKNEEKLSSKGLGNDVDGDESAKDDANAGDNSFASFWNVPSYVPNWQADLSIKLTKLEGEFLRERILKTCPDSLFAFVLEDRNRCEDFLNFLQEGSSWDKILPFIIKYKEELPEEIVKLYELAYDFSLFTYATRVVYNLQVSQGQNSVAVEEYDYIYKNIDAFTKVDLDEVFHSLGLVNSRDSARNNITKVFLVRMKNAMIKGDLELMKKLVTERECNLKGSERAKTFNHSGIDLEKWYGGGYLDYRLNNARRIAQDIYLSQEDI